MGDDGPRPGGTGWDGDDPRGRGGDEPPHEELAPDEREGDQLGGDPVCWLERVCDRCGGLSDGPPAPRCDRCGAPSP